MTENILTYYFGIGEKDTSISTTDDEKLKTPVTSTAIECEIELSTIVNNADLYDKNKFNETIRIIDDRGIVIHDNTNIEDASIQHLINNTGLNISYLSFSSTPSKENIKKIINLLINTENRDVICLVGVYNLANAILEYAGYYLHLFVKFEPKGSKFFIGSDSGMVIVSRYPCIIEFTESTEWNIFNDKFCRYGILKTYIYLPNSFIPIALYCTNIQKNNIHIFYNKLTQVLYNSVVICDYKEAFAKQIHCENFKPIEFHAGIYSTFPETIYNINNTYGSLTNSIHNIDIVY